MRNELAFSRRPGGKLNGAEPNGSSASAVAGLGDTAAPIGAGGGAVKAAVAVAFAPAAGIEATFCSVGVSVDVVDADFAVIPMKDESS